MGPQCAFSSDGKHLIGGSSDIKIWDTATGRTLRTLTGHTGKVRSVRFTPDANRIVSGSADATIKVWEVTTGRQVLDIQGWAAREGGIRSVAFSPDGSRIVTGGSELRMYDVTTAEEVASWVTEGVASEATEVNCVAFGPGNRLAATS